MNLPHSVTHPGAEAAAGTEDETGPEEAEEDEKMAAPEEERVPEGTHVRRSVSIFCRHQHRVPSQQSPTCFNICMMIVLHDSKKMTLGIVARYLAAELDA